MDETLVQRESSHYAAGVSDASEVDPIEQAKRDNEIAGGLFRSQAMTYVQLQCSENNVMDTMYGLGQHGKLHLVDLAPREVPSKEYIKYKRAVNDCIFWERKIASFIEEMDKNNVRVPPEVEQPRDTPTDTVLDDFKAYVEPLEAELVRNNGFKQEILRQINMRTERVEVLRLIAAHGMAGRPRMGSLSDQKRESLLDIEEGGGGASRYQQGDAKADGKIRHDIIGIMPTSQIGLFNRVLFRVTRGNNVATWVDLPDALPDPATGVPMQKSVFFVVVLGDLALRSVQRAVPGFEGTLYTAPGSREALEKEVHQLKQEIMDQRSALAQTETAIVRLLEGIALHNMISPIREWQCMIGRYKAVCDAMMKCHFVNDGAIIVIEGWSPTALLRELAQAIQGAVAGKGIPAASLTVDPPHPIKAPQMPPTYFVTNKVTSTFQTIVDTYGVPRYQEVNPGLFTIVTFPYMFGIMYGDIGHGLLLALGALMLILYEKQLEAKKKAKTLGEIPSMAYGGRYAIFFMGLFALYCGTVYNDCMSIPLNVYGSNYSWNNSTQEYVHDGGVYPYGLDPSWYHKSNTLAFINSFKMKLSVSIGVTHMLFGIILSLFNHLHFKDYTSIWYEFIPRMVFLLSTFGYMIFMILYKWFVDYSDPSAGSPPNLIQTMIAMFLSPGNVEADKQLYPGQAAFQAILVLFAFLSVPVMLCGKPLANKKAAEARAHLLEHDVYDELAHGEEVKSDHDGISLSLESKESHSPAPAPAAGGHGDHDGPYSFSDDMIHQAIHTIEFVLGCVSNTASYLRLWALSLAHSELAEVFWSKMMMQYGLQSGSAIGGVIGVAAWAGATFGVLLCMDVLECFLHALRLHWVEFQNKFYYADGYKFTGFSFVGAGSDSDE